MTAARLTPQPTLVGWCGDCQVYESPYPGPGVMCPMDNDRYLRKRRMWICGDCCLEEVSGWLSLRDYLEHRDEYHDGDLT